jgi:hypothetical protein
MYTDYDSYIFDAFSDGRISSHGAVSALIHNGYSKEAATALINEWAEFAKEKKSECRSNVVPADPAKIQELLELVLAMFPVTLAYLAEDSRLKDDDGHRQ